MPSPEKVAIETTTAALRERLRARPRAIRRTTPEDFSPILLNTEMTTGPMQQTPARMSNPPILPATKKGSELPVEF